MLLIEPWSQNFKLLQFIFDHIIFQGEALFQTHENLEHLAMMERVLGPLPQHMIIRSEWDIVAIRFSFFVLRIKLSPDSWPHTLLQSSCWQVLQKRCTVRLARGGYFKREYEVCLEIATSPGNYCTQFMRFTDCADIITYLVCQSFTFMVYKKTLPHHSCSCLPILYTYLYLQFFIIVLQNLVMQHVDHSAGDLIDLLQGLLRYDPTERLTAREALKHPFFTRDLRRCGFPMWNCRDPVVKLLKGKKKVYIKH